MATSDFMTPINADQQALRLLGYTGEFGSGQAYNLKSSLTGAEKDKFNSYVSNINKYGMNWAPTESLTTTMSNNVNNPLLPAGTEITPVLQSVQNNELMKGTGTNLAPTATNIAPANTVSTPSIAAQHGYAQQIDIDGILYNFDPSTGGYTPVLTNAVQPMQAAQGTVSNLATVQGQLEKLYADVADGSVPTWAKGAVQKAEQLMAARGLGASSIAAEAITSAIQQSALPIAAADAATYFQMDLTNLSNEQTSRLENFRARQQNMLTDTAIQNAALQFNASSEQQTQQFVTQLVASLKTQNASFANNMEQFNVSQTNAIAAQNANNTIEVEKFNTQLQASIDQFNATLTNQRQQFNSSMAFAIEQSNVNWRRQVNIQNTASVNAAMQVNAQNSYNLSATASNNLWQAFRDEAYWLFQSGENQMNRDFQAAMAAMNREFAADQQSKQDNSALWSSVGKFASSLFFS